MRCKFTCQVSQSNNGTHQVHLVADDGIDRADVFLNVSPKVFYDGERPVEGKAYYLSLTEATQDRKED